MHLEMYTVSLKHRKAIKTSYLDSAMDIAERAMVLSKNTE